MECPRCDSQSIDMEVVEVSSNNGQLPPDNFVVIEHCVCRVCGQEWIE